ncbi:MAG TPA: restriction endonuclease subunit S [Enterococcus sp.]|nr:restriction endonuclease subunit S [Enterococcus sp.]
MSNDTQPEIRFPGFTEAWEQRKLDDVVEFYSGLTYSPDNVQEDGTFVLRSSNVKNGEIIDADNVYVSHEVVNSGNVQEGDVIVVVRNGSRDLIGKHAQIKRQMDNTVIGAFMTGVRSETPDFTNAMLDTQQFAVEINKNLGATINQITTGAFKKMQFVVPKDRDEREAIGTFFRSIDDTITLHQRKLDLLKETKKGFLQKMFPKNGAKVPEIRFPGFTEDWEQRKLASMTNYKNGKGHEDKQSTIGKLELINLNSISISGGLKHSGKFIDEADDTLQKDDLVMILSDVGHGDLLGRVALIPEDDRFVLNQRVALLRPNATADPQFLFSYINAHQYYFKAQGAGMSQLNISKGSVENFISFVPIIEEQKKIGTFFKQLDNTITLHQRKLDLLKETKKGFLQKMFV